ncbi:hypothetical protein [Thiocystis violascens]|uniref:Uncharacterized protein n=1 Tax=Thiocystis violascens (strain ATCC 17096 / DSM 198 / 6111) TaxID=765911 RepID=I3Y9B4_THIV6|nr:hypothetical protein [Thiocystis violascens]AFL73582.1 hypothetical protein Thivi_1595 [Thiocystis violascens DSM 198]
MFSIRHWRWWNWLLAGILMPLLAGGLGVIIFIGLAAIALIARVLFGPAPQWDSELDGPILNFGRRHARYDDWWVESTRRDDDDRFFQEGSYRLMNDD